jgi:hypothetical protein
MNQESVPSSIGGTIPKEGSLVRARNNPTHKQLLRRLRRKPESDRDPRYEMDAYWALRFKGYPHSYAKRAFRDQPPKVTYSVAVEDSDNEYGCDPDDILFPPGTEFKNVEVEVRPDLQQSIVEALQSREKEYTVWDQNIRGFGLRVRASGHKSYVLYYRDINTGMLRKSTIGTASEMNLDEARWKAKEILQGIANEQERLNDPHQWSDDF